MNTAFPAHRNFAKQFNRYFGLSPTCFRQDNKQQRSLEIINKKVVPLPRISPDTEKYQSMDVVIQSRPSFKLAYLRFIDAYDTRATQRGVQKLLDILNKYQINFSSIIGVVWDNPEITLHDKCRYDIGVMIESELSVPDILNVQQIPGGNFVVYQCEVFDNDLEKPWDDLVTAWLPYSGYLPSGSPGYEIFHKYSTENLEDSWVMDICIPLTPL